MRPLEFNGRSLWRPMRLSLRAGTSICLLRTWLLNSRPRPVRLPTHTLKRLKLESGWRATRPSVLQQPRKRPCGRVGWQPIAPQGKPHTSRCLCNSNGSNGRPINNAPRSSSSLTASCEESHRDYRQCRDRIRHPSAGTLHNDHLRHRHPVAIAPILVRVRPAGS